MTWFVKISSNKEVVWNVTSNYVQCFEIQKLTSVSLSFLVNAENICLTLYSCYNSFLKNYALKRQLVRNDVEKEAIQKRPKHS